MDRDRLRAIADRIDGLADATGRWLSWLTLGVVLITFAVVVFRYAFNLGWIAMQESVSYLHALVFMLGAAYTMRHDGHVRVDIYYRKASTRRKAWVDLLGTLVFLLPVCGYVIWASWDYVLASWALREGSREAGGLPGVFLLKTAIPLMAVMLMVQGCSRILRSLIVIGEGHRG